MDGRLILLAGIFRSWNFREVCPRVKSFNTAEKEACMGKSSTEKLSSKKCRDGFQELAQCACAVEKLPFSLIKRI